MSRIGLRAAGLFFAVVMCFATAGPGAPPAGILSARTGADATSRLSGLMDVHLRKLHLVRPDLIYYPIAVEVWC
jgi:hypothetical protein